MHADCCRLTSWAFHTETRSHNLGQHRGTECRKHPHSKSRARALARFGTSLTLCLASAASVPPFGLHPALLGGLFLHVAAAALAQETTRHTAPAVKWERIKGADNLSAPR